MNQTVKIGDQDAIILVPQLEGKLAVVYLDTLKKLAKYFPLAKFSDIKADLIRSMESYDDLGEMLAMLEEEIKFHKTVNIITEYKEEKSS